MSYIEVDCALIKEGDNLIGLSLVAQPQIAAEMFCGSMSKQLVNGKGDILVNNDKITFINPRKGKVPFAISAEDANVLQQLLSGKKGKIGLYRDGFFTPGFKIVLTGRKNGGKKIKLERI